MTLGPPCPGEVVIYVNAAASGGSFTMGTQTVQPSGMIPLHRHIERDETLFIHKGQGRATIDDRAVIVVPGVVLRVPKGSWLSLRNTGTGLLQFVWVAVPAGLELFFREFSQLGSAPGAAAFEALARRHGIELRADASAPVSAPASGHRRHRRRGGRGRGRGRAPEAASTSSQQLAPPVAAAAPAPQPAVAPSTSTSPQAIRPAGRHRRRRRGGAQRGGAPPGPPARPPSGAPAQPKSAASPGASGSRGRDRQRRRGRIKEVYMGGRWIQVSGQGPVISPGPERYRGGKSGQGDDDTPSGPLTVPL